MLKTTVRVIRTSEERMEGAVTILHFDFWLEGQLENGSGFSSGRVSSSASKSFGQFALRGPEGQPPGSGSSSSSLLGEGPSSLYGSNLEPLFAQPWEVYQYFQQIDDDTQEIGERRWKVEASLELSDQPFSEIE